jgi:hypothetical protein
LANPVNDEGAGIAGNTIRIRPDGSTEGLFVTQCDDGRVTYDWRTLGDPPPGAPAVTPRDLVPPAQDEVERKLPTPNWSTPADWDAGHFAYVQVPTYFWVDDATWSDVSARATAGAVWAEAVATPEKLVIDPGDGSAPVECIGQPPEYVRGTPTATFDGCDYVYRHSSAVAENGTSYPVTVSIVWHVTWTGSDGTSGDLGELTTTAEPRDLQVAEVQAIVTD